ncbi:ComEC/Rec2 family competence protein [Clostridium cylindrosporum]|uniref:ComE operon protein 3 n=1 Tax=Clostridium cylindrosporum DSM 605 TaxID=1121307 RepID=A0A0J8DA84_CLOCY|nr:MBL fold metallo-hydrolase [Clostridium cylindrosporum]KMT22762.1 ComE operon protein 3 [Clostridium cylindrosporum DSM 605]
MSRIKSIIGILLLSVLIFVGCAQKESISTSPQLEVSVIDVGQGDAIFIKTPDRKNILIDTGSKDEKDKLYSFLSSKDIKNIDILVGTHPHEDHIGNMPSVIKDFTIGKVYMPKVTHTSKTFKDTMSSIREKSLKITSPKSSEILNLGDVKIEFIAPNSKSYKDLNNYSIVVKLTYGRNSFMLMGDAEKYSEKEIISKGYQLKSDVIKLGHHGSFSSSSKKFIEKVNPKYAVVSCSKNNEYGHPHRETIKLLENLNISLIKTYESGTVTFISDGKNINVNTKK